MCVCVCVCVCVEIVQRHPPISHLADRDACWQISSSLVEVTIQLFRRAYVACTVLTLLEFEPTICYSQIFHYCIFLSCLTLAWTGWTQVHVAGNLVRRFTSLGNLVRRFTSLGDLVRRFTSLGDLVRRFTSLGDLVRRFTLLGDLVRRFTSLGDLGRRLCAWWLSWWWWFEFNNGTV